MSGEGRLAGKVALITGAGSGFGKGAALLWAREGASIAVVDLDAQTGASVAEEIRSSGGKAIFIEANVANGSDARAMVAETVAKLGKLDVLYNNAGILGTRGVHLTEFDDAVAERLLAVNIMGVYHPTKHAIPAMIAAGGGSIISTGSESAFQGNTGFSVYSATKAAVLSFARVVAMEYVGKGIRSNAVSPGAGRTPMHNDLLLDKGSDLFQRVENIIPMKRAAEPEDVARAALFFASDDSRYITGQNIMVDGGWTVRGYF
jgi:meso-butanediol dehydrogenase / (S,S)-butanediol dehydrogenase / diacetyl reductase